MTIREQWVSTAKYELLQSPGFAALPAASRDTLERWMPEPGNELSGFLRFEVARLLRSDEYKNAAPPAQAQQLEQLMEAQSFRPAVAVVLATPRSTRAPYEVVRGEDGQHTVRVSGREVPVKLAPLQDDSLHQHTVDDVAKGLAGLPPLQLSQVTKVVVAGAPNPSDAAFGEHIGRRDFRSYMTAGADGVVTIYPAPNAHGQRELDATLLHETGHTLSHRRWGHDATDGAKWAPWREAIASDRLFVSDYAAADVGEDFAETFALYSQVKGTEQEAGLRQMLPERFRLIDALVAGEQ
ncbi:MAG: hypothetical protein JNK82_01640 [Myxococcaceae bacterium]|nr:hypothetical protein [Myxococcaceae bacterium]